MSKMESKVTRGPWLVKHSESKTAFNVVGTIPGGNYKIARCPYMSTEGKYPGTDKREKDEAEANAKLIAAAPDMRPLIELVYKSFGGGLTMTFTEADAAEFERVYKKATE